MSLEGSQLSHYRVLEKLGEGAFGVVYRAEDLRLGRHVALKVLTAAAAANARVRERLRAEARAVAALDHPHICLVYELDEHQPEPAIAMQLVEGETLRRAVERGPLSEDRTREIVGAVASALSAAHAHGIVHRDVKGENILLGRDGSIRLSDFGVARFAEAAGLTTSGFSMVGTPAYMSPEQISGQPAGEAADQFALGVVTYECLTGRLPFAADSVAAALYAIANVQPQPPSRLRPGLGPGWDAVLARVLAKDPAQRFDSVEAFGRAVARTAPGRSPASGAAASGRAPGTPSVAVLYFDNLSSDSESDYFCAGITEDLLTDLSKIPGLKVASRNAVARYRGQNVDIPRVAEELGVRTVLEGSVRRAGNRLRINAQLIDAADGFHLWAERYDRTLEDVFAVQEDLARAIATALRGRLSADESKGLARTRPAGVEAYDLYLKGRDLYARFTPEDNRRALECFERALELDPDYALAWAGIADGCAQMHLKCWDFDAAWLERGIEAGRRAVSLNPSLPEAHKALALVCYGRSDTGCALSSARRAVSLNPGFSSALDTIGWALLLLGDVAGSERSFRRSISLDPHNAYDHGALAHVLRSTGRYREAVEHLHRWQRLGPGLHYQTAGFAERAWALAGLGELGAAEEEIREARAAGLTGAYLGAAEALVAASSGDRERARRLIERHEAERPDYYHAPQLLAEAAATLGDAASAARILRDFEGLQTCHQKYWLYRIAPGLRRVREAPELRDWLGERGRRIVWPLEAPALAPEDRAQFTEYGEASGLPVGDEAP